PPRDGAATPHPPPPRELRALQGAPRAARAQRRTGDGRARGRRAAARARARARMARGRGLPAELRGRDALHRPVPLARALLERLPPGACARGPGAARSLPEAAWT